METNVKKNPRKVKLKDNEVLVFQAKEALTPEKFALAAEYVKQQSEETGIPAILIPYSVKLKGTEEKE